jgi:exoribonuclease R
VLATLHASLHCYTPGVKALLVLPHVLTAVGYVCCPAAGDMLDAEARTRSRSLYFPWGAVPMFPRSLAEGPFSLGSCSSHSSSSPDTQQPQQQECCAFSVCASLNDDGSLGELVSLGPSTIRVQHRLTYDEVSLAFVSKQQ